MKTINIDLSNDAYEQTCTLHNDPVPCTTNMYCTRKIIDLQNGAPVMLYLRFKQFRCPQCGKTYTQDTSQYAPSNRRYSNTIIQLIEDYRSSKNLTFNEIARAIEVEYGIAISASSIQSMFYRGKAPVSVERQKKFLTKIGYQKKGDAHAN